MTLKEFHKALGRWAEADEANCVFAIMADKESVAASIKGNEGMLARLLVGWALQNSDARRAIKIASETIGRFESKGGEQ